MGGRQVSKDAAEVSEVSGSYSMKRCKITLLHT